ncbi:MAG TPA: SH3 domain-containing protein [Candidatus Limnocylindria bacterium]|jgi:hypothetical protein
MRRAATIVSFVALVTAGCGFMPRIATPSPEPSPTATPAPSATPAPASPSEEPSEDPEPPDADAIPRFAIGSVVVTNAPGLRVRSRPGTEQRVVTTLGLGAELLVGMGPIVVDDLGWYMVRDADDADPAFEEGWVAAGFEPDPFLVSDDTAPRDSPFVGGFADTVSGEFGPTDLAGGRVTLRWIATTGVTDICNFALDLSTESGDPVRAVRTPVGSFPASGELPYGYFRTNGLNGERVFLHVQSNCSWAVSFVREEPAPSPS